MRASRHSTVARVAQPATRVDTTCWQLFRPAMNTAHFFIFCCRSYVKLLDYLRAEKNFLYFRRPREARGICHICHMVNPALDTSPLTLQQRLGTPRNRLATLANRAYSKEFFGVHNFSGSSSSPSGVWGEAAADNDFGAI